MGDLYLFFHIEGKEGFRRNGIHLYSDVYIDYTEAILGTVVQVIIFSLQIQITTNQN